MAHENFLGAGSVRQHSPEDTHGQHDASGELHRTAIKGHKNRQQHY
jgi:hypothetical protein